MPDTNKLYGSIESYFRRKLMSKREFKFSEDYEIRVKIKLECFDSEIHGTLKLLDSNMPKLEFDSLSGVGFGTVVLSDNEKECLNCKSEIHSYKLYNNESLADDIWPRYIIQGEDIDYAQGVEVILSGLSEWIDQKTCFNITETEIKKDRPEKVFDELIQYEGKEYRISSNYNCSINKRVDRDFIVSETTTVSLINTQENISLEEAEALSYKVNTLFSLLLVAPISVECAWLVDNNGKNRAPFYFSTIGQSNPPYRNTRECLMHPARVSNDIGWGTIFTNYFSDEKTDTFKNMWSRITTLLSYSGTWDFQILGYVSILDSYCSKHATKKGMKLNKKDYKCLKSDLNLVVDNYLEDLGGDYKEVLNSFKEGIEGVRNTNLPTFREKYDFMLGGINQEVRNIVHLSTEEFLEIKSIRDSAAHGLPIITKEEKNISYEFSLKDRLLVLLTYLVYKDFGISPSEFAKSLKNTLSRFVRNSGINTTERDRLVGTVPFWEVDKESFNQAKESKNTYVGVIFEKLSQTHKFSIPITNECQSWLTLTGREPKDRNLIDYIKRVLFEADEVDIEYIGQAYLVYGDETIELSAVCRVCY